MIKNAKVASKIWKRCAVKKSDGSVLNLCFMDLPRDRTEDLVDFHMTQYVPRELTYMISGLPNNKDAMMEYREIIKETLSNPTNFTIICCQEKNDKIIPDIIGCDIMKLVKRGEPVKDEIPPHLKTKEARDYLRILRDWNNLYPVPDILEKFDLDCFYDDLGVGVHENFSGYGIVHHLIGLRRNICQANGVPMTGAWTTSIGTEKAAQRTGWEQVYEISREDIEKVLNIKHESNVSSYKYFILRA